MRRAIKSSGIKELSGWDLSVFGILDFVIPPERVLEIGNLSKASLGVFPKFKFIRNGVTFYVKAGKENSPREPITEVLSYKIAKRLNIKATEYRLYSIHKSCFDVLTMTEDEREGLINSPLPDLTDIGGRAVSLGKALRDNNRVLVCMSRSFLEEGHIQHSCQQLYPNVGRRELYQFLCKRYEHLPHVRKSFDMMITFDYIINNTDRHTRNFGFIQGPDILEKVTPLYDHGLGLLSDFSEEMLWEEEANTFNQNPPEPFGSWSTALSFVDKSHLSEIDISVPVTELYKYVDEFSGVYSERRIRLIKELLKERWSDVQAFLS